MNTLTIPTNRSSIYPKNLVLDIEKISFIVQESNTKTTIYTEEATGGSIYYFHGAAANGAMGDIINNALLNSNGGNAVATIPAEYGITYINFA
jgi:hypothetical protein